MSKTRACFCKEVTGEQDSDVYMASFDIQSLFTTIPLDETLSICVQSVYKNKRKIKGLLKRGLQQLLMFSRKSPCFLFNNIYYQQVDGGAMDSLWGPTFNIFLLYYESKWLVKCPVQIRPKYYCHYLDVSFLMFRKKNHVKNFKVM